MLTRNTVGEKYPIDCVSTNIDCIKANQNTKFKDQLSQVSDSSSAGYEESESWQFLTLSAVCPDSANLF